ncbi:MAG: response regulator [Longimicrobiales bacterium]|nr:response regulator [Longimicrobiales bacterium]
MSGTEDSPNPDHGAGGDPLPPRVLVVEDDGNTRHVLVLLLQLHGYEATGTASPREGLDLAKATAFDLVISDLQLPEMSGIELARRLARRDGCPPMIAITSGSESLIHRARDSGAFVTVLRKPIDVNELLDLADGLVTHR